MKQNYVEGFTIFTGIHTFANDEILKVSDEIGSVLECPITASKFEDLVVINSCTPFPKLHCIH